MFLDLLRKRRSVRQYEQRAVEQDTIDLLVEAMLRSPSSRSLNPWEFVVIAQKSTLQELAGCKPHGADFVSGAALAIAVCADPNRCDVWIEDCSIAAHNIHLAAADLGLGSCWVQIRRRGHDSETGAEEVIKELLELPVHFRVEAVVALGYPKESKEGHPASSLPHAQVSYEKYGLRK